MGGHIVGKVIYCLATFAAAVVPCWLLLRHGLHTGRRGETRVLLAVVVAVAAGALAAVLASWPTS